MPSNENTPLEIDPSVVAVPRVKSEWTVQKVLDTIKPQGSAPVAGSSSPVPFFHLLERLKTTKREGWRRFGIERGESIADHMYRMSLISLLAPPSLSSQLDVSKCMKMCLIHDMAESLVGDITPVDGVPKTEKNRREEATIDYISNSLLGNVYGGDRGKEIRELWLEYEESKSKEAEFVHDVDKIELLCQMVEYEKRGKHTLDLGEFAYVATKIRLEEVKDWAQQLLKEREEFWASQTHIHGEGGAKGGMNSDLQRNVDSYYSRN